MNEEECTLALKDIKNGKSPGSDGLITEFYKIIWHKLTKYFIDSIKYSYEHCRLTEMQKQGIITLLPKKDKELTQLNNWRPFSLLNTDYKISTKAIANRKK